MSGVFIPTQMIAKTYIQILGLALVGAMVSCSSQLSQPTTKINVSATSQTGDSNLSTKVFNEVNSYRRAHGASNLVRHAGLDRLAQRHCEYLLQHRGEYSLYGKNVSHMGFEGRALAAREEFNMPTIGENVAATTGGGSNPAPLLVNLWAHSKNHEFNMSNKWTYTGIGSVKAADGTIISTQIFGNVSNSQMQMVDRFRRF